ncbi:MAG: AAA family ATPase [Planctomycetota bacterium]
MKRSAEDDLVQWKNATRRKPLIIRGARQVGKTWLVEHFAQGHFKSLVMIDLEKRKDVHIHFAGDITPGNIIQRLEFVSGQRIIPGETLLFFDEIQACPRALTALRYFHEEMPQLHLVAAGSLLEFALSDHSVPVGRVQYLPLHPMNFQEYLYAAGKEIPAGYITQDQAHVPAAIQEQLLEELRTYFFVGGMPECVKTYLDTGSMLEAFAVQSEILASYRDDFAKYAPRVDKTCLDTVLLGVARQVGEQIKYTHLDPGHSIPTVHKAFDLLARARVIHPIWSCNPSGLPLGATATRKRFKAAMVDIGLYQRLCQVPVDLEFRTTDLLAMYRGRLAEQFVAQELAAADASDLHYWSREQRGSSAEVDFVVVRQGGIYPVEVKSGKGGSLKSLHLMLKAYPNCPEGLVLYAGPYARRPEQKLTFLPLYCAAVIGKPQSQLS